MNDNTYYNGIGLDGAIFIVFLILKLTHVIDWSWWWITAPLWIPFGIALVVLGIYGIVKLVQHIQWKRMEITYINSNGELCDKFGMSLHKEEEKEV